MQIIKLKLTIKRQIRNEQFLINILSFDRSLLHTTFTFRIIDVDSYKI